MNRHGRINLKKSMFDSKINKTLLTVSLLAIPALANAGISGTKHDLSTRGWGTTELCRFCHTTHSSDKTVTDAPLWNHKVTAANFTVYSSVTSQAAIGQPGSSSKLCLSCHDGTVAVDSFAGATGATLISSTNNVGTDLSNDHPIGFTYDSVLSTADKGLVTPSSTSKVDAAGTVPLFAGKMECASCHQAHDNTYTHFLRVSNAGSGLCLKCHTK